MEKNQDVVNKSAIEADWFLRSLVNLANYEGMEFGITLQADGFLISGTLISGKKYFKEFAEAFSGAFEAPEIADEVKQAFSKHGSIYEDRNADDSYSPTYIHLREAKFFSSNQIPLLEKGALWRGRLSEVTGFILGNLRVA